jgi:hypothetical protein
MENPPEKSKRTKWEKSPWKGEILRIWRKVPVLQDRALVEPIPSRDRRPKNDPQKQGADEPPEETIKPE